MIKCKPHFCCGMPCVLRRDMFGACLKEDGMVELVCHEVAGTAGKAPALSFLAAVARGPWRCAPGSQALQVACHQRTWLAYNEGLELLM